MAAIGPCDDQHRLAQLCTLYTIMRPTSTNGHDFTHSRHGDGTVTSVCNHCPLKVGRTADPKALAELESAHVCQQVERRQVEPIVHRTYIANIQSNDRAALHAQPPSGSGMELPQSTKVELIRAHLFLYPCSECEKSAYPSPNDERVCVICQFSPRHRWKELAAGAALQPRQRQKAGCHELQLYSSDDFLISRFADFIGSALRVGNAVVVVATEPHRGTLLQQLVADGFNVTAAIEQGRYIPLDAADTLSTFMVNGAPDPSRFSKAVDALIVGARKAARGKQPRVAACGECAPLLWQQGKPEAAIRLEVLWDEIAKTYEVDTLCAYPGASFRRERGSDTLQRILAEHSAVYAR